MPADWKEEAEASQQSPLYPDRFPAVVTTDDLVMEVGKQHIKITNLEKLLTGLMQTKQQGEALVEEVKKKLLAFEKSNRDYVENNQKLGEELSRIRETSNNLEKELSGVKANLLNTRKSLDEAVRANFVLKSEYQELVKANEEALQQIQEAKKPKKRVRKENV